MLQDGTATGWGYDYNNQATPPPVVTNPAALYAGGEFSIAWLRDPVRRRRSRASGSSPRIEPSPAATLSSSTPASAAPPAALSVVLQQFAPGRPDQPLAGTPECQSLPDRRLFVVVSNDFGAVTSLVANVTVPAISFVAQPTNTTTMMNTNVTLSATVAGTAPLSYRWQKNGQDLSDTNRVTGSATPSLAIANVEPGDTGSYRLIVTNSYASVTSDVAVLTVLFPQPLLNVDFGSSSQSSKTGLAAVGQTALDYWNGYAAGTPGITNILFADGSPTRVSVVVSNAPSWFWNNSTDPMMHEAIIPVGGPHSISGDDFRAASGKLQFLSLHARQYLPGCRFGF